MDNVDPTIGAASYGKQFIEDILYDMPIAILRPGGPVMNAGISGGSEYTGLEAMIANVYGYYNQYIQNASGFKEAILGKDKLFFGFGGNDDEENNKEENNETTTTENTADQTNIGILEDLFTKLFVGKYARFYTFSQDFRRYTQYVNTLCHLFIHFLGIGNKYYVRGDGQLVKYTHYNDTWEQGETDKGETLKSMFGSNRAIFAYYQPESAVSQSYSNSTQESSLSSTLTNASNMSKEFAFMVGTGVDSVLGQGVTKGLLEFGADLNTSDGLIGRLFGNVAEGAATIIAGNNMDIPEIYSSSSASTSTTLTFKLVSPYGDHESIFLYVLRPLARLMAMSLPRQFGPNSYTSPFLVQAFAKGQFNIQCGIVTNLSVKRCGNGGESFTVTNVPTELEVTMEIQDMYEMVTLTNEYIGSQTGLLDIFLPNFNFFDAVNPFGTRTAARLLFNNIGLMDFCGAYCGFNLNAPETHTIMTMIIDMYINRISDVVEIPGIIEVEKWQSPQLTRWLSDAMYNTVSRSNRLSI